MNDLNHKEYAVVTGAASGIGKCVSELLISKGVYVFALDIQTIETTRVNFIKCDVSSEKDLSAATQCILSITRKIDYLVLSAGILCYNSRYLIKDLPQKEWSAVLDTNITGAMLSMRTFIPLLINNRKGSIVTYSSDQVVRPIPKSAPYLVSKAAIESLTRLLAIENINYNIRANCIRTASVDTNFLSSLVKDPLTRKEMMDKMNSKMPLGIISPQEIADITWFLLSDTTSKMTGQVITIDGGILLE